MIVDIAPAALPEPGSRLSTAALEVLHRRGVEVRLGVSVKETTNRKVTLTDGTTIASRTLIWGAGVAPSPLIATLGVPTAKGRLVVDECLALHDDERVLAAGDAAAVPDLTKRRTQRERPVTGMTAQHVQRHRFIVARNVAASRYNDFPP